MRSQHKRLAETFPSNGLARGDYEALAALALEHFEGLALRVADFMAVAKILGFDAEKNQMAKVLRQMAEDGKLFQTTHEGNFYYLPGLADDVSDIPF